MSDDLIGGRRSPSQSGRFKPMLQITMCGRARLSSDVSEIKIVFSIPTHRPTPNIAPSWNWLRVSTPAPMLLLTVYSEKIWHDRHSIVSAAALLVVAIGDGGGDRAGPR